MFSTNNNPMQKHLQKRHRTEKFFKFYGMLALSFALAFLGSLMVALLYKGLPAFFKTEIQLEVSIRKEQPYSLALAEALEKQLLLQEKQVKNSKKLRQELLNLLSSAATLEFYKKMKNAKIMKQESWTVWLKASDRVDLRLKSQDSTKRTESLLTSQEETWLQILMKNGKVRRVLNPHLITGVNSGGPEQAGLWGAIIGSLYTICITLLVSVPLGVCAALYLEEFAKSNRFSHLIEIHLNNLVAVPSIIFGLLGVAILLNILHLPRSSSLVGGLTLALIMIPNVVIAARVSLQGVPQSIRDAAYSLGASKVQTTFHHILPLAFPGIITGTILGMARALGESAPLLMVGMVAFIVDPPLTPLDPATTLPVQIFSWSRNPERGFVENTAAAILVLLVILGLISFTAFILRKRFEKTW